MVVACLALSVALSGVGYAATMLPRNSVGTAQLKKDAVIGSKVADGSLSPRDMANEDLYGGRYIMSLGGGSFFSLRSLSGCVEEIRTLESRFVDRDGRPRVVVLPDGRANVPCTFEVGLTAGSAFFQWLQRMDEHIDAQRRDVQIVRVVNGRASAQLEVLQAWPSSVTIDVPTGGIGYLEVSIEYEGIRRRSLDGGVAIPTPTLGGIASSSLELAFDGSTHPIRGMHFRTYQEIVEHRVSGTGGTTAIARTPGALRLDPLVVNAPASSGAVPALSAFRDLAVSDPGSAGRDVYVTATSGSRGFTLRTRDTWPSYLDAFERVDGSYRARLVARDSLLEATP